MRRKHFDTAALFIAPGLLGFAAFYILPFFISVGYAFVDRRFNGSFVGLRNFIDLFRNQPYLKGLVNTGWFIGTGVPVNMLFALGAALLVNRVKKNRQVFTLVFLIPLVIPSGSMVFFWKMLFSHNGYINYLLNIAGIDKVNWLETANVRLVILVIYIWKNLGYNMILFLAGLSNIPKEYYEAAWVDGANKLQCFRHITVVGLVPTLVLVLTMSIINSFKVFKEVYLVTGNYPYDSIYMLQHFMNNMFNSLNYQKLATATTILVLIITAVTQLLFKLERRLAE